ncbi:toxin YdaT domain-containing protein [Parasalinivibrio latis]|uniref:hypothetical protein n=1 Tax=Parasalinivibrio latis TaxID=2952610 RepID=UPI0030E3876D
MTPQKHRLMTLHKYISKWLQRNGMSQSVVAQEIVESFRALDLDKALQVEDIFFMDTGDVFTDVATNRQKIFRWLGFMDNGSKRSPSRLFFVEQAIVAAMPPDIRASYLNEVYGDCGMFFGAEAIATEFCRLDPSKMTESMIKEGSEAQIALLQLGENPNHEKVREAIQELRESIATNLSALRLIDEKYGR